MKIRYKEISSSEGMDDLIDKINLHLLGCSQIHSFDKNQLIKLDISTSEKVSQTYLFDIDEFVDIKEVIWTAKILYLK